MGLLVLVALVALLAVHASFAVGVKFDAEGRESRGEPVLFVKPLMWGLAAMVGGVFAVGTYWLIHHSSLRRF
jgi:hypothetical protein